MRIAFAVLLCLAAASAGAVSPKLHSVVRLGNRPQLRTITQMDEALTEVSIPSADPKMCPTCINVMIQGLDILVDAIGNEGIIGGCEKLCGYLPKEAEAVACSAVCIYVGIEALVAALNVSDPDPIFVCEAIDVCPATDTAAGKFTNVIVAPSTGPLGTTFWINTTFQIINETGTGFIQMWAVPPNTPFADGIGEDGYLINLAPGFYSAHFQLPTSDKQVNWPIGLYNCSVWLCEGYCASTHPHQYVLDHVPNLSFIVTPKQ